MIGACETIKTPEIPVIGIVIWSTFMMGVVAKIAAVVLTIAFLTFVAFFGRLPALR